MGKHSRHQPEPDSAQSGQDGVITGYLRDDDIILIDGRSAWRAEPGTAIRDLSCIACGKPAGDELFAIHALVSTTPCSQGFPHMTGSIVIQHAVCNDGDAFNLTIAILSQLGAHST